MTKKPQVPQKSHLSGKSPLLRLALIVHGIKPIENRSWTTAYRGPLLIHAGLLWDNDVPLHARVDQGATRPPEGGIVGIADLVDVVTESDDRFFVGPYGWKLAHARRLPFPDAWTARLVRPARSRVDAKSRKNFLEWRLRRRGASSAPSPSRKLRSARAPFASSRVARRANSLPRPRSYALWRFDHVSA